MTQKEYYKRLGWDFDPYNLMCELHSEPIYGLQDITYEECDAYLNEKYPVIDGINSWLIRYRAKKNKSKKSIK